MPLPSITKVSGTPDEPSAICTLLSTSDPMRAQGLPHRARKRSRSSRLSRMAIPSIATPASFRTASCGASAAQGTHQLANILSRRRSEEHTSELQSLMRISYAVFCLKKKQQSRQHKTILINRQVTQHNHKHRSQ